MIDGLRQDLGAALRHARHRPVLAVAVVATLAACIAATTTAIGLASAVLWRPLPFAHEGRLVFVWEAVGAGREREPARVTGSRYAAWRDASAGVFESIALFGAAGFTLDTPEGAVSLRGVRASARYFDTLGIAPLVGRAFAPGDEVPGHERVVVLSHAFWQQHFGGRRDVIGRDVRLSGEPFTIIGVMPDAVFPGWPANPATVTIEPDVRQFWVPIPRTPELDQSARAHVFGVVGRLAAGVSAAQARDRLAATDRAAADTHGAQLAPLREQFVRDARAPLLALAGATLAILLIACANLASLHVTSFEARRSEFAVRAAIGASAGRLIRQVALEALLTSMLGAVLGLALARVALRIVPGMLPPGTAVPDGAGARRRRRRVSARVRGVCRVDHDRVADPSPAVVGTGPARLARARAVRRVPRPRRLPGCRDGGAGRGRRASGTVAQRGARSRARLPDRRCIRCRSRPAIDAALRRRPRRRVGGVGACLRVASARRSSRRDRLRPSLRGQLERGADARRRCHAARGPAGRRAPDRQPGLLRRTRCRRHRRAGARRRRSARRARCGRDQRSVRSRAGRPCPRSTHPHRARLRAWPVRRRRRSSRFVGVVRNERFRGLEQPSQPAFYLSTRQFPQTDLSILARTSSGDALDWRRGCAPPSALSIAPSRSISRRRWIASWPSSSSRGA